MDQDLLLLTAGKIAAVKTVLTDHKIDIRGNLERLEPAVMQDRTNEDLPCLRGNRLCFNLFVDDSDFSDKVIIDLKKNIYNFNQFIFL